MQAEDPMETENGTARSDEDTVDYDNKVVNVFLSLLTIEFYYQYFPKKSSN